LLDTERNHGQVSNCHHAGPLRLLALHRNRDAGLRTVLTDSICARIQSGRIIYDQAAAPLKPGLSCRRVYPDYKAARGLHSIREWTWSGHTLRCLKVLTANENRAGPRVHSFV
jgi:hypothetical protein